MPGLLRAIADHPQADAFVIACFAGLDAARELADVPVIGIAEAGMKTATMLVNSFSVVTSMDRTPLCSAVHGWHGFPADSPQPSACP